MCVCVVRYASQHVSIQRHRFVVITEVSRYGCQPDQSDDIPSDRRERARRHDGVDDAHPCADKRHRQVCSMRARFHGAVPPLSQAR